MSGFGGTNIIKCGNTVTKKNAFDGVISRLGKAEEKISELKDILIEISKMEKQKSEKKKEQQII